MSSQSCRDQSFPESRAFPQAVQEHYNHGSDVNTPTAITKENLDTMLPPTRALPFKSKRTMLDSNTAGSTSQGRERQLNVDGDINMGWEAQEGGTYKPPIYGREHDGVKGLPHETSRGVRAGAMALPETHDTAMEAASLFDTRQGRPIHQSQGRFEVPPRQTKSIQRQADIPFSRASQAEDVNESPSASDTELLGIFRTLEDAIERWRLGFQGSRDADLGEVLSSIQDAAQRLEAHLHPSHSDSRNGGHIDDHTNKPTRTGESQAVFQPTTTTTEAHARTERRHTKEYKQWKEYYLFACRLYETKEERTDPEFIHRFLRGMPGKRALRWVQMGLLHCYPSMVRLSDRRSGTTLVFTRDLRWSHVCEMVTRKLKLPFAKWERVRVS